MKKLSLLLLAALAVASCAKQETPVLDAPTTTVALDLSSIFPTKIVEDQATSPVASDVTVLFKNGSTVLSRYEFSSDDLAELNGSPSLKRITIENVPSTLTQVDVMANGAYDATAINNNQKGNSMTPMAGSTTEFEDDVNPVDGHPMKTCKVDLEATMARIEVIGNIDVNTTDNGVGKVVITGVYLNNIKNTPTSTDLLYAAGDEAISDWANPTLYTSSLSNLMDGSLTNIPTDMAAAYHIFEQSTSETTQNGVSTYMPHVILKVEVYKDANDTDPIEGKNFITIRSFINESNPVNNMINGNIYRLDISSLADLFKNGGGGDDGDDPIDPTDPYPEAEKCDAQLDVTIKPWIVVNTTPAL